MDVSILNGEAYVLLSFLKKYSVNEQTVMNGMSRNRKNQTRYFEHIADPKDKRLKWIKYSSITPQIMKAHKLPTQDQIIKSVEQHKVDKTENFISLNLSLAFEEGYKPYLKHYIGLFFDPELVRSYARTHAVFYQIQQMRGFQFSIDKIFKVYRKMEGLVVETDSLKFFYAKLKKFERYSQEAFIHKSLGKTKNNRKISEPMMKKIKELYMDRSQYSYVTIHEKVNYWAILDGYSEISLSTVKKILADPYIQNQCKPYRNGKEWERYNLNPFRLREEPKCNGELWQVDGSRLQFPYMDENNRPGFLQLFVVMDVHSRKIVGYSTGKTENHTLAIDALRKAVETTGYLPFEIVSDNGSCFKHEKFKILEQYIAIFGSNFRRHKPDSPREKAHVERFFSTFQTVICKGKPGYIGEGIKSRREEGRPAKEVLGKHSLYQISGPGKNWNHWSTA